VPASLAGLKELETLNLAANRIKAVPAELGALTRLKHLHLMDNRLRSLPASLARLRQLVMLTVAGNPRLKITPQIRRLPGIKLPREEHAIRRRVQARQARPGPAPQKHLTENEIRAAHARLDSAGCFSRTDAGGKAALLHTCLEQRPPDLPRLALQLLRDAGMVLWLHQEENVIQDAQAVAAMLSRLSAISNGSLEYAALQVEPAEPAPIPRFLVRFNSAGASYEFLYEVRWRGRFNSSFATELLNRVLADQQADGRFYAVPYQYHVGPAGAWDSWTDAGWPSPVMFLTEDQRLTLNDLTGVQVAPAAIKRTDEILAIMDLFRESGVLDHVGAEHYRALLHTILREPFGSEMSLLAACPDVVDWFDCESLADVAPDYTRRIENIARISHGVFRPEKLDIQIYGNHEQAVIELSFAGTEHTWRVEARTDWFDLEYCRAINNGLEQAEIDGRVCFVETGDQTACLIFLTAAQKRFIEAHNLLDFHPVQT
jgi:hypothetical protein